MKQPIQQCGSTERATYEAPTVESETISVESGFAQSAPNLDENELELGE
jgi:hypothetical protein